MSRSTTAATCTRSTGRTAASSCSSSPGKRGPSPTWPAEGLLGLRARLLDHLCPLGTLGLDVGAELLGRSWRGVEALVEERRPDVGHVEDLGHLGVELPDERARGLG